ncbi:hypothetical protein NBRC116601_20830 [Cognatishimia sp. WU-CL00825]|uniref:hypothetical protein n=1 Tax=Cognatishimia sp. WU-CL00825 TaxID=3127658 RepID=UPI003101D808
MIRKTIDLLLPALFPSWRFFKTVGPSPRIEYRVIKGGVETNWQASHPIPTTISPTQMVKRLFWNPQRNTQLYMVALAERLVSGVKDHSEQELTRLVAEPLQPLQGMLQFRLLFLVPEGDKIAGHVLFESTPVALSELHHDV